MNLIQRFAVLTALAAVGGAAGAQAFPVQPITIVVPFPAGGIADSSVRLIAAKVAESVGQQVLVDNRGGAGGQIGANAVRSARPDGHTLFLANIGTHAINRSLYTKLSYDPTKDFEPVTQLLSWTHVLVVPQDGKARSAAELVAQAKANPGRLTFASQGVGSGGHLLGEMFKSSTGIEQARGVRRLHGGRDRATGQGRQGLGRESRLSAAIFRHPIFKGGESMKRLVLFAAVAAEIWSEDYK